MESLKHDSLKINSKLDLRNSSTIEGLRSPRGGDHTIAGYLTGHLNSLSKDAVTAAFVGCKELENKIKNEIEQGYQEVSSKVD